MLTESVLDHVCIACKRLVGCCFGSLTEIFHLQTLQNVGVLTNLSHFGTDILWITQKAYVASSFSSNASFFSQASPQVKKNVLNAGQLI